MRALAYDSCRFTADKSLTQCHHVDSYLFNEQTKIDASRLPAFTYIAPRATVSRFTIRSSREQVVIFLASRVSLRHIFMRMFLLPRAFRAFAATGFIVQNSSDTSNLI